MFNSNQKQPSTIYSKWNENQDNPNSKDSIIQQPQKYPHTMIKNKQMSNNHHKRKQIKIQMAKIKCKIKPKTRTQSEEIQLSSIFPASQDGRTTPEIKIPIIES